MAPTASSAAANTTMPGNYSTTSTSTATVIIATTVNEASHVISSLSFLLGSLFLQSLWH